MATLESADRQAEAWLTALDNFGRPPPRKHLVRGNFVDSSRVPEFRSEPTSVICSPLHHLRLNHQNGDRKGSGGGGGGSPGCGNGSRTLITRSACSLPNFASNGTHGTNGPNMVPNGHGSSPDSDKDGMVTAECSTAENGENGRVGMGIGQPGNPERTDRTTSPEEEVMSTIITYQVDEVDGY